MTQVSKIERKAFQVFILILAIICFLAGGTSAFGGINASAALDGVGVIFGSDSPIRGFTDNQFRFGFGVFFTQGLILLFFLRNIEQHAVLFRFVALALFIGGLARVSNVMQYGLIDSQIVAPTVIELAVIPLLVLWHRRVIKH